MDKLKNLMAEVEAAFIDLRTETHSAAVYKSKRRQRLESYIKFLEDFIIKFRDTTDHERGVIQDEKKSLEVYMDAISKPLDEARDRKKIKSDETMRRIREANSYIKSLPK